MTKVFEIVTLPKRNVVSHEHDYFFPYFFHVHLNILDKVVSSKCAIFGTPVYPH
jgi:hypothetical protein